MQQPQCVSRTSPLQSACVLDAVCVHCPSPFRHTVGSRRKQTACRHKAHTVANTQTMQTQASTYSACVLLLLCLHGLRVCVCLFSAVESTATNVLAHTAAPGLDHMCPHTHLRDQGVGGCHEQHCLGGGLEGRQLAADDLSSNECLAGTCAGGVGGGKQLGGRRVAAAGAAERAEREGEAASKVCSCFKDVQHSLLLELPGIGWILSSIRNTTRLQAGRELTCGQRDDDLQRSSHPAQKSDAVPIQPQTNLGRC